VGNAIHNRLYANDAQLGKRLSDGVIIAFAVGVINSAVTTPLRKFKFLFSIAVTC